MADLGPAFFGRDTVTVARELLGAEILAGTLRLRIVETEAYRPGDSGSHAWRGRTTRNAPMWGPPGHLYVYLCYGVHWMLNLVTEEEGVAAAVLVRGAEVLEGHALVSERRGGRLDLLGPGKVAAGLGVDGDWSGRPLGPGLRVLMGAPPEEVLAGPRVGIDYALPEHRLLPWRFLCGTAARPGNLRKGLPRAAGGRSKVGRDGQESPQQAPARTPTR